MSEFWDAYTQRRGEKIMKNREQLTKGQRSGGTALRFAHKTGKNRIKTRRGDRQVLRTQAGRKKTSGRKVWGGSIGMSSPKKGKGREAGG